MKSKIARQEELNVIAISIVIYGASPQNSNRHPKGALSFPRIATSAFLESIQ